MSEPTGHCPYLGLKQNRAIRFASPTPEHRCYVGGEPIEIPVDQSTYCLSQGHVHCPLYMGLSLPTTSDAAPTVAGGAIVVPAGGLRGWFGTLTPRDRAIYVIMIVMLTLIVGIYLFAGLRVIGEPPDGDPPGPAPPAPTHGSIGAVTTAAATQSPPTPSDLPK